MSKEIVKTETALASARKLNKSSQQLAIRRASELTPSYVPHLSFNEVRQLAEAAAGLPKRQQMRERNRLLVQALFDSCLRVSELLRVAPQDIVQFDTGWGLRVFTAKRRTWDTVAISASLAAQLQAYAYRHGISPGQPIFEVNASRVFQIIKEAFDRAGLVKPRGVGTVHVLRHSGAIERLRQTGNPQSVQEQLRHSSFRMTMRYFKTLSHEESVRIQQEVDFQW